MVYDWKNQVVLITGAATGIGAAVVRKVLEEGVKHVAILDVNQEAGIELQNELNSKYDANKVKFINCDVTDEEKFVASFKEVVDTQGGLDVVINNAGLMKEGPTNYKKLIELNVIALITGTLKGIEYMSKENGGSGGTVINISSIAALLQTSTTPIYNAAKSAVLQFSNCIGADEHYSRSGVRVVTMCFGGTETALLEIKNIECVDDFSTEHLQKKLPKYKLQKVESAAQGLVEAYKLAKSGSTWLSTSDKPVRDITESIKNGYKILGSDHFELQHKKNQVVLITGAATGIGAAVVRKILEEGVKHVAILDVDQKAGIEFQNELNSKYGANKVKFIKCDVTDEETFVASFKEVVDSQGGLDVVINNAGLMNDDPKVYKKMIDVNVTAVVTGTLNGIDYMSKENGGRGGAVINISSVAALIQGPLTPIYSSTKSAVLQFSNCIGEDDYYSKSGVRVLAVCFGATNTSLLDEKKFGCVNANTRELLKEALTVFTIQKPESAAQGVVDAYKYGKSGSTWLSATDLPPKDITETVIKGYQVMGSDFVEYANVYKE